MIILYVIVGALAILSLGLYAMLFVLKSKTQNRERQKVETMQAVAESQSENQRNFIPNGHSAE